MFLNPRRSARPEKIPLAKDTGGWAISEAVQSADGKTLYIAMPTRGEVVVFDLSKRAVVNQARFREQSSIMDGLNALARLFVNRAQAKFLAQPMLTVSPDEKWLAFIDLRDGEGTNGVFVVQTEGLRLLGHPLRGIQTIGVRASEDGNDLLVVSNPSRLFVLQPATGQVRREFKLPFDYTSGFLVDQLH